MTNTPRKPALFDPNDTTIKIITEPDTAANNQSENQSTDDHPHSATSDTFSLDDDTNQNNQKLPTRRSATSSKLLSIGTLFLTSLTGLIFLWLSSIVIDNVTKLLSQNNILGWAALALAAIALTTLIILIIREISSLFRLKKLGKLQSLGRQIHIDNQLRPARKYLSQIKALYQDTPDKSWYLSRIKENENEIMDGREIIEMIDNELGQKLDTEARQIISATARKVSLITAIAPGPLLDMAAVTMLNISMIRKIAAIYGVRPGFWGILRLGRNIIAHLALTGGISITSDLLHPLIGTSIAAKLSKRLGEGLFNGAITIRIGLSALEVTRPIPYVSAKKLSFAKLVSTSLTSKNNNS